jgi:hypothetical protein
MKDELVLLGLLPSIFLRQFEKALIQGVDPDHHSRSTGRAPRR